ncbi:MAG: flavodoxin domain-containing protein [bacterium]
MATRILVAYGTGEGQTARVAQEIAKRLQLRGHLTNLVDLQVETPDLAEFDGAALGGSVHGGKFQQELRRYTKTNVASLNNMPTWFFGISLSEAGKHAPIDPDNAAHQIEAFFKETGWIPREHISLAGALKYRDYNFFKRGLMEQLAGKAGEDTDTSRNWEYTNWAQVDEFADGISDAIAKAEALKLLTR